MVVRFDIDKEIRFPIFMFDEEGWLQVLDEAEIRGMVLEPLSIEETIVSYDSAWSTLVTSYSSEGRMETYSFVVDKISQQQRFCVDARRYLVLVNSPIGEGGEKSVEYLTAKIEEICREV
jgi:hypothetical protein